MRFSPKNALKMSNFPNDFKGAPKVYFMYYLPVVRFTKYDLLSKQESNSMAVERNFKIPAKLYEK